MNTVFLAPEVKPKTIYTNEANVVYGTSLVLEETKKEYLLQLSATQALSIDTSLLSNKASSYKIDFQLKVIATGNYVINFADCNILQMEFYRGESLLQFSKQPYEDKWNISIINYGGIAPSLRLGIKDFKELCCSSGWNNNNAFPLFKKYGSIDALNTDNTRFTLTNSDTDYYAYSLNPFILNRISIHVYTATTYTYPPSQMQIYGSNDFKNWTPIYSNTSLNLESHLGDVLYYTPNIIRPYKCFKFHLTSIGPYLVLPPMSMEGIQSNRLFVGEIVDFPGITAETNGYNVTLNTDEGCSMEQRYTPYGATPNSSNMGLDISRTSADVPFKLTYTFPESVRPIGFFMQQFNANYNESPAWFAWYGSDDLDTWEKAVELRNILPFNTSYQWNNYSYPCDFGSSHRYWQLRIYTLYDGGNRMKALYQAFPLLKSSQYSEFDTIIPKMMSNSQDGYTVSASSATTGNVYNMYDMDENTYCEGSISGTWNTDVDMGDAVVVKGFKLTAPDANYDRMPKTFKIQGSTDNSTWVDLKTVTLGASYWSAGLTYSCDFDNSNSYQYYRLLVSETQQGSYVRIAEIGWTTELIGNPIDYYVEDMLVPLMTADSQDGYVASASSSYTQSSHYPYKAFDRASGSSNKWLSQNGQAVSGSWLKIKLPEAKVANIFIIQAPNESQYTSRVPRVFKIQGSNDDSSWTDLVDVSVSGWSANQSREWHIENTTAYMYYRILVTSNGGDVLVAIGEWSIINRTYYNE